MTPVVTRNLLARVESDYAFPALPEYSAHRHIRSCFVGCPPSRLRNRPRFASGRAQETERRQGELSVCPARSLHRETGLIQNSPAPPVAPGSSQGPTEPPVGKYASHDPRPSPGDFTSRRNERLWTFALLRALRTHLSGREPDVEGVCLRWASPPPHT